MPLPLSDPDDDPEIGTLIALLRTSRGWNQADLARAANVPASTISEYERGRRRPKLRTLERLMGAMGLELSALEEARAFLLDLYQRYGFPSARDRDEAPKLLRKLNRYAAKTRPALVKDAAEFQSWALSEHLCLKSTELAADDAAAAVEAAELAVTIAEALPGNSPWVSKVRWNAWAHLGNARRVAGNLREAEEAFRTSDRFWRLGRRDPSRLLEESRVLRMKAALRRAQRRLPESLDLLETALAADQRQAMRGTILISTAKAVEELGRLEEAIALLHEAEPFVDREREPRLYLCLRHNLMDYLSKSARAEQAAALLPEVTTLTRHAGALDRLRVEWTRARIEAGLGRRDEAISLLDRVRVEFASRRLAYDTALVCLELASLYAEEGSHGQVKSLARHMVPIFQAQDVHREAQAALSAFRQAAEAQQASVELVRRVLDFLYRARHHAGLRFEG
jgi:transcriptional regulator with XRE-family HTH domain